jgi:hypothetical protein
LALLRTPRLFEEGRIAQQSAFFQLPRLAAGLSAGIMLGDEQAKLDYRTSGKDKRAPDELNSWASVLWHRALRRDGHPGLINPINGMAADHLRGLIAVLYGDDEFMEAL